MTEQRPDDALASCYRLLEVPPGSTEAEVRSAYRFMASVWHPDRFGANEDARRKAQERMKAINDAYASIRAAGFPRPHPAPPKQAPVQPPVQRRPPNFLTGLMLVVLVCVVVGLGLLGLFVLWAGWK